jgi:hypothetical protein
LLYFLPKINKLGIKMYTRLWVRVKTFCCDRNGALSKKLHCYRKKLNDTNYNSHGCKK